MLAAAETMKPASGISFKCARHSLRKALERRLQRLFKTPFSSPTLATLRARRPAPAAPLFPGK